MKFRLIAFIAASLPQVAAAGGLFLPGTGAVSTSRAGAAVASADDGEALALNPAGIAKARGHTITVSAAMIQYAMEFQRRGTYDAVDNESYPYAGQPFALVRNDAKPPLGIGSFGAVPVIAFVSDLGGRVGGLHLGVGIYAPNGYPFRSMCTELPTGCQHFSFSADPNLAPPGTRYDIIEQDAALILPSLVAAYSITPTLDVGLRLTAGRSELSSTVALWGTAGPNYAEDIQADGQIEIEATDGFVPAFGLGIAWRPHPAIEIGANFSSALAIHAKGTAKSGLGPNAGIPGLDVSIGPLPDEAARCAKGGTAQELKACVDLGLPATAQLGARYKFLDATGKLKGDVELDLDLQAWGGGCSEDELNNGDCSSSKDFRVVVDATTFVNSPAGPVPALGLKDGIIRHGFKTTLNYRLGGSYHIPIGAVRDDGETSKLIVRGGLAYDPAVAKTGWLRADIDGAARFMLTAGAAYRARRFEVSVGGGAILEGSPSNPNVGGGAEPCNPTMDMPGCGTRERQGPDPTNPVFEPDQQAESPIAQGDYKSHYILLMLGVSTWF